MAGLRFVRCVVTGYRCSFAALGIVAESGKLQCAYVITYCQHHDTKRHELLDWIIPYEYKLYGCYSLGTGNEDMCE